MPAEQVDASGMHANQVPRVLTRSRELLVIVLLPAILYFVLRPDDYGLVPNGLDPIFYTGYAFNLDDSIVAAGADHYFITRWSAYLPMYFLGRIFEPTLARLLWRWILAAAIGVALASLARRLRLTVKTQIFIVLLVITAPVFVRSFTTDYVEYTVVSFGIILANLVFRETFSWTISATIGVCVALIIIANPVAGIPSAFMCLAAFVLCKDGWSGRAKLVAVAIASFLATLGFGLVWFRWRYGVDNIYTPTIEFIQQGNGGPGPFKAPAVDWLGRRLWIYLPLVVLVLSVIERVVWRRPWTRVEKAILVVLVVENVWQTYAQFWGGGFLLEVSFYWCFAIPSLAAGAVVVVGRLVDRVQVWAIAVLSLALIIYLHLGSPTILYLPQGVWFAGIGAGVAVAVYLLLRHGQTALALAVVLGLSTQMQIGAPPQEYPGTTPVDVTPHLDWVYGAPEPNGVSLDEILWFGRAMDQVPNDGQSRFVAFGGHPSVITAFYQAQVSGNGIMLVEDWTLPPELIVDFAGTADHPIALYGQRTVVDAARDQILLAAPHASVAVDDSFTDPVGIEWRLVVIIPA